jgi:transposase InsO family protein
MPEIPRRIRSDSGPQFTAAKWREFCTDVGVELVISPIESHNSLGLNERLHSPLRRIFLKVKHEVPSVPDDVALRVSVKALNVSVGVDGLIPTLLVFGTMPQLPMLQGSLGPYSSQEAREKAINSAMAEHRKFVAEMRIREALAAKVSPGAEASYHPG